MGGALGLISLCSVPHCIMDQYNLKPLIHNGSVMAKICKGMYGFPQAGIQWEMQINLKPGRVIIIKLAAHSAVYNLEMFPINNGVWYPASCMFLKPSAIMS
jgi:hypothetical protein